MIRQVNPEPTPQPEPSDNQGDAGKNSEAFQQQFQKEFPEYEKPTTLRDITKLEKATSSKTMGERMRQDFPVASEKVGKFTMSELAARDAAIKEAEKNKTDYDFNVKQDIAAAIRQQYPNLTKQEYKTMETKAYKYFNEIYTNLYNQALKADPNLTQKQFNQVAMAYEIRQLNAKGINISSNATLQQCLLVEVMTRAAKYKEAKKNPDKEPADPNAPPPVKHEKLQNQPDTTVMDEKIKTQLSKEFSEAELPTSRQDYVDLNNKVTGPNIESRIKEEFPNIEKPKSRQDVTDITAKIPKTLKEMYPNLTKPEYKKLRAEQIKLEKEIYTRTYNQVQTIYPNITTEQFNKIAASVETARLQKEYPNMDLSNLTFREAIKLEAFARIREAYPTADPKNLAKQSEKAEKDIKWQVHDEYSEYTYLGMKVTEKEYNKIMSNLSWGIINDLTSEENAMKVIRDIYKQAGVTMGGDGMEIET